VIHADAKLTAREAISGLPDGHIKIVADRDRDRQRAVPRRHLWRRERAAGKGLTWGAEDLSAELGAETNRDPQGRFLDPYRLARALLPRRRGRRAGASDRHHRRRFPQSRAVAPRDEEARRDGFTGKMAIHPAQVPVINEVLTPTAAAIAKARAVVAAFASNPGKGAVAIDGVMYDRPHLERARQLLARAGVSRDCLTLVISSGYTASGSKQPLRVAEFERHGAAFGRAAPPRLEA